MRPEDTDPKNEGHSKEWQDRARVVLDAKEAAKTEASPKQSPLPGEDVDDVERAQEDKEKTDPAY